MLESEVTPISNIIDSLPEEFKNVILSTIYVASESVHVKIQAVDILNLKLQTITIASLEHLKQLTEDSIAEARNQFSGCKAVC